jgi:hypothetical protein
MRRLLSHRPESRETVGRPIFLSGAGKPCRIGERRLALSAL